MSARSYSDGCVGEGLVEKRLCTVGGGGGENGKDDKLGPLLEAL